MVIKFAELKRHVVVGDVWFLDETKAEIPLNCSKKIKQFFFIFFFVRLLLSLPSGKTKKGS